jgi:pre-mRNA-splicing factor ATP-dependent RNA helicase DHX15/PRP43
LEFAPLYYDLRTFPDGLTKRALRQTANKGGGPILGAKRDRTSSENGREAGMPAKKRRKKKQKEKTGP